MTRAALIATKADHVCHYCRVPLTPETLTADHIVPRSKGGTSAAWNLAAACSPCNNAKANLLNYCDCRRCAKALRRWAEGSGAPVPPPQRAKRKRAKRKPAAQPPAAPIRPQERKGLYPHDPSLRNAILSSLAARG